MKKPAAKGNIQKNKRENGYKKTQMERKQKCAKNPLTVRNIETNGVKAVVTTVQSKKKSTVLKEMNEGVGSTSGNGTSAKNPCHKSGNDTGGPKKATKHKPPPKTASTAEGCRDERLSRNKRNDTESEEEESLSTTGSSEEVTAEEISDEEEEEEEECDGRKESSEGDGSEEGTESLGLQRRIEETVVKGDFGESKCSRSPELDRLESSIEEETRDGISSAGLKDEAQDEEINQEDASERLTGRSTHRPSVQPPCTTGPAKEPKYKMFKRSKAEKRAEKDEKRKVKAEKQRLEKEAKQKAKEDKKNKKKPPKAEKRASVTKEIQSTGSSRGKYHKTNEKNQPAKPTKDLEEDSRENGNISEVTREEENEDEPALTKAMKGQNRFLHLKEKGKDFRNILAKPEEEISEGEPLVLESDKVRQRLIAQRKGATTFNRVSGWIQKNVPQKFNLRKKLSAWTKAMGISRWLSKVKKQNRSPEKSKRSIVKHRMALRVASKTSLVSKNKMAKDKAGEGGVAAVPGGEKDTEAKYAVVLPRMNELGKTKTAEASQAAPSPSAPSNMTETAGEASSTESRPPKPGARLVLPVKPDLSLLKSIKTSLPGGLPPGVGLSQRNPCSTQRPESSLKTGESDRRGALENYDGVGVQEAARGKLDRPQINQTKLFLSGGTIGPTWTREPELQRDAAAGMPRSNGPPFPNGDAGSGVPGTGPICDEETDREVAQLMCEGGKYGLNQPEMHWAGNPRMSGDPQVRPIIVSSCCLLYDMAIGSTVSLCLIKNWLRAENLLPHQTVEKLSKWTVYDDGGQAENVPAYKGRGPWVSEDPTQEMLESRLSSTQVLII